MFTPQQIQEQTFSKAVFGGYDMGQVDEFLEPLTEDYIALYKENSVLKSKMKILVEKLEEYRAKETEMQKSVQETQDACSRMIAEAEQKCREMESYAAVRKAGEEMTGAIAQEKERLEYAKQTALNFIDVIENDIRGHLELLETLKSRDLKAEKEAERAARKPYDWQSDLPREKDPAPYAPAGVPVETFASELSENMEKLTQEDTVAYNPRTAPVKPSHPESSTIKFDNLQFGKNYDPTGR